MSCLVFCLEEASAQEMLLGLLPRVLPECVDIRFLVFEGKQDMHKRLEGRLRGWLTPNTRFVVIRDQDSGDCAVIKAELRDICDRAHKPDALIRIACRELEAWYFGDLPAVEEVLNIRGLARLGRRAAYRDPDMIVNPARELRQVTNEQYQKLAGSRELGRVLSLDANRSPSFNCLVDGLRKLAC